MSAVLTYPACPDLESLVAVGAADNPETALALELPVGEQSHPVVYDPYNERVKLYGVGPQLVEATSAGELSSDLVGKITVYAKPGKEEHWSRLGFQREAVIKGYFTDGDAHLWATYTDESRGLAPKDELHDLTVELALSKDSIPRPALASGFSSEVASPEDCFVIADLLDRTFSDYPTPICPRVIAKQIEQRDNLFRLVRSPEGEVAAVASAELDHQHGAAEMTDCATRPDFRGKGLMAYILRTLESDVAERFQISDLYTIARADEVGMNCVFSKLGYAYEGRLINNCRMPNGWESMNVWCRNSEAAVD